MKLLTELVAHSGDETSHRTGRPAVLASESVSRNIPERDAVTAQYQFPVCMSVAELCGPARPV